MSEENNIQQTEITLRDTVLKALTGSGAESEKVLQLLTQHPAKTHANDIVYALLLEMEMLHRVMEQIYIRLQEQHKVMGNNMLTAYEEKNKKMLDLTVSQQMIFRSQFRRLIALHRERLITRLLLFSAMLLVTLLAGIGVFYIYKLIVG